jgi:hypothetical protein
VSTINITPKERLRHLEGHYADRVVAFRQRLAQVGLRPVQTLLVDTGKNVHWATAWTASALELVRPFRLRTTYSSTPTRSSSPASRSICATARPTPVTWPSCWT